MPLRFGYSPFVNHELVREALKGYKDLVPEGRIEPSSECSGPLSTMVAEGRFDAALVSMPIAEPNLFIQHICTENLLVCLRADDPWAQGETIPRSAVQSCLKIFFDRMHHPLLYDELMRKFAKVGIDLQLSDFVSAPAEMQFLVKEKVGFGLLRIKCRSMRSLPDARLKVFHCGSKQHSCVIRPSSGPSFHCSHIDWPRYVPKWKKCRAGSDPVDES